MGKTEMLPLQLKLVTIVSLVHNCYFLPKLTCFTTLEKILINLHFLLMLHNYCTCQIIDNMVNSPETKTVLVKKGLVKSPKEEKAVEMLRAAASDLSSTIEVLKCCNKDEGRAARERKGGPVCAKSTRKQGWSSTSALSLERIC